MQRLNTLLPAVLARRGLQTHVTAAVVVLTAQRWLEEQLPALQGQCKVETLKDGALTIVCSHSVALQECQQRQTQLLAHLRQEYPGTLIRDARVTRAG